MQTQSFSIRPISPIPVRAGVGLKPAHFQDILEQKPDLGWFEVHPENYMVSGGPMLHYLGKIREHYPLSFHSIGMSIGSESGIDETHLGKLKRLIDIYQPALVSDHLSWSRWQDASLNDLLPMPYSNEALTRMAMNIEKIQETLKRTIAIENPSSYFNLNFGDWDEAGFLVELASRTGARILLDINNVYVSACNHGWNARDYIHSIPENLVAEIHLAGHKVEQTDLGELRIDDHGSRVCEDVWTLYEYALTCIGRQPTLIEWDTDVPAFSTLLAEAEMADQILADPIIKGTQTVLSQKISGAG